MDELHIRILQRDVSFSRKAIAVASMFGVAFITVGYKKIIPAFMILPFALIRNPINADGSHQASPSPSA